MTDIIQAVRKLRGSARIKHPIYRSWEAMKRLGWDVAHAVETPLIR